MRIYRSGMEQLLIDKKKQDIIREYVPDGEILDDLVGFFSIFSD